MHKILFFIFLFLSCGVKVQAESNLNQKDKIKEGLSYIKDFGITLKKNLVKTIKSDDVDAGFLFCNVNAKFLKDKWEKKNKKLIGRTSNRIRNPRKSPLKWMKPILKKYDQSSHLKKLPPQLISHKGNQFVVKPIYMKSVCLKCHGQSIGDATSYILEKKYPKDKAVGYKVGEFRGIFWIKL